MSEVVSWGILSTFLCYNLSIAKISSFAYNSHMIKKLDYIIKLTYDKSYKGYVADVVNLYGCMSQGKTKEEALKNVEKAIKAYMRVVTKKDKSSEFTKRSVETLLPPLNA